MKYSICILTYGRNEDICNLLVSLFDQAESAGLSTEIILIDNNPVPVPLEPIRVPDAVGFTYIHPGQNLGVARGRNLAAARATGEYLIFLDDDVIIPNLPTLCRRVGEALSDRSVGAVAMRIVDHHAGTIRPFEIPHARKDIDMQQCFYTSHCIGAGHGLMRTLFNELGGFDPDLGLYGMEEIELSYRLISNGFKIEYLPECEVRHLRSPSGRLPASNVVYKNFVNKCIIAKRYLPTRFFLTHVAVWGALFLVRSKSITQTLQALERILGSKSTQKKFDARAMAYMNSIKARLLF